MKKTILFLMFLAGMGIAAGGTWYLIKSKSMLSSTSEPSNNSIQLSAKPKAGYPNEAREWRLRAWRDENGDIPAGGLVEALTQRNEYINQNLDPDGFGDLAVSRLAWISQGPRNAGGRTRSILVHPTNANILWAGSLGGGVWSSSDAGGNWVPMNHEMQNYVVNSMAMEPGNPSVLYAGTGEGFFNFPTGAPGGGIFKSTEGGANWRQLTDTIPRDNNTDWINVNRITVAPSNPLLILASTNGGIMRSEDGGEEEPWIRIESGPSFFVAFNPIPGYPQHAIAEINQGGVNKVKYSTEQGTGWTDSGLQASGRIELAYQKDNPSIVYALVPDNNPALGRVHYSNDGGHTFAPRSTTIPMGEQPIAPSHYNNTIWVSPNDPNLLVAGGKHLFRSADGGNNFDRISSESFLDQGHQPHVDQHCVVAAQDYSAANKRVYVCNDGGVYSAADITATTQPAEPGGWENKSINYVTTQYYGAAGIGPTGLIYGGMQDNGTALSSTRDLNAASTKGGDGGFNAIDPYQTHCYGEYISLKIHRSTGCQEGDPPYIHDSLLDAGSFTHANFIAPFVLDPNNPNRMIAGGRSLWRTENVKATGQPTWTVIKPAGVENISAVAVAPGNSNIIWVAYNNTSVYKTVNGIDANPTWTAVDDNSPTLNPFPRFINRILIDNNNPDIVYVAQGGFSVENLRKTINGGSTVADEHRSGNAAGAYSWLSPPSQ